MKIDKAFTYDWRYWSIPELTAAAQRSYCLEACDAAGTASTDDDVDDYKANALARKTSRAGWPTSSQYLELSLFRSWYV